jgi:hypothetical protein
MISEKVEPVTAGRSLSQEPIRRRVRVGPWSVDAVFVTPPRDSAMSLSRQAACLAEELAVAHLDLDVDAVRLAAVMPSGRPIALVDGIPTRVSVSISHLEGLVGAALCDSAWVGLDIVDPAEAGRGLDAWFTPDELSLMPDDHGLVRALLWAAKEAHLDSEFRPRTVTSRDLSAAGFAWIAQDRFADVRGTGCFIGINRHIVAVAATPARRALLQSQTRFPEAYRP